MTDFKIKDIETHWFAFDLLKTRFYVNIEPQTKSNIEPLSNSNRSKIWNTIVENTIYKVRGKTYGNTLCSAWENFEVVKQNLALPNWCRETFNIEWNDFCGKRRRDVVSVHEPIKITSDDEKCTLILEYEFELISDHKWYYWESYECCVDLSTLCGNSLCNTLLDECGLCKPINTPYNETIINYTGSISTKPTITVNWVATNFKAINLTNWSRIDLNWEIRNPVISQWEYWTEIKSGSLLVKDKRKLWLWLELSPWDNRILLLSDSPVSICLSWTEIFI